MSDRPPDTEPTDEQRRAALDRFASPEAGYRVTRRKGRPVSKLDDGDQQG